MTGPVARVFNALHGYVYGRWIVDYKNEAGIALYQRLGLGFVPDEVAVVEPPEKRYAVVSINPKRVSAGYGYQQPERDPGISATCYQ